MKKTLAGIAILIIGLFIYFLLYNPRAKQTNIQLNPIIENKISKETISQKIKTNKDANKKAFNWLEGYDKQTDHTPKVGLIQAFREFRKVKRCRVVIEAVFKNEDPYQAYLSRINRRKKDQNLTVLTPLQHELFDKWSDSCLDLLEFYGEQYTAAHERFRKRFYQTKPNTKIEKDFAKSWPLKEETQYVVFKFHAFKNGYDENNIVLSTQIKRKIKYANGMLGYININNDIDFSIRTTNEIAMYENQITELEGILNNTIIVDDNYLDVLNQEYHLKIKNVGVFLKQNISSDAFLTLAPHLLNGKSLEIGFYDSNYLKRLSKPVYQLFACSMDAECGELAQTMVEQCFKSHKSNEIACGKGIEEYYLNHYFSPNQLIDIDQLLSYLFENYAKN